MKKYIYIDDKKYIILSERLIPVHRFDLKLENSRRYSYDEIKDEKNVGICLSDGVCAFKVADLRAVKAMIGAMIESGVSAPVIQLSNGDTYFIFNSEEKMKKNKMLALGIVPEDVKSGENQYIPYVVNGEKPKLVYGNENEIGNLPFFLKQIDNDDRFDFLSIDAAEEFDADKLINEYISHLFMCGFGRSEIKKIVKIVDKYILSAIYTSCSITGILNDYSLDLAEDDAKTKMARTIAAKIWRTEKKHGNVDFQFHIAAKYLKDKYHIIKLNGTLYEYNEGIYEKIDEDDIRHHLIQLHEKVSTQQVNSSIEYLGGICKVSDKEVIGSINPYRLNLANCWVDLERMKFNAYQNTPEAGVYEFNKLPVNFDENAHSELLDDFLWQILGGKEEVDTFWELIGTALIRDNKYAKCGMFVGPAGNGKSTLFSMLTALFGDAACAISLHSLQNNRFAPAGLENKLINIGDEIGKGNLADDEIIKKIINSPMIEVEKKGIQPYFIKAYATHIFSCNNMPKIDDNSNGFLRRCIFFDCNHKIAEKNQDKNLVKKLTQPDVLSYALNCAMLGLLRLRKRNDTFSIPDSANKLARKFKRNGNTFLRWLQNEYASREDALIAIQSIPRTLLYDFFKNWVKENNEGNIMSATSFYSNLCSEFPLEEKPIRKMVNGSRGLYYVVNSSKYENEVREKYEGWD